MIKMCTVPGIVSSCHLRCLGPLSGSAQSRPVSVSTFVIPETVLKEGGHKTDTAEIENNSFVLNMAIRVFISGNSGNAKVKSLIFSKCLQSVSVKDFLRAADDLFCFEDEEY